jgi:hypothetical protein
MAIRPLDEAAGLIFRCDKEGLHSAALQPKCCPAARVLWSSLPFSIHIWQQDAATPCQRSGEIAGVHVEDDGDVLREGGFGEDVLDVAGERAGGGGRTM